jgi:hypothetical protein
MELCQATHVAPPEGLGPCIAAINAAEGRTPGAAADLLTKLVRMLSEVQVRPGESGGGGPWREGGREVAAHGRAAPVCSLASLRRRPA